MRRLLALGLLGSIGCASGVPREEYDPLQKKVTELERIQEAQNAKQARLYEDLVGKHDLLQRKLADVDAIVKILETTAKRIEERLRGGTTPGNGGGGGEEVKPSDVASRTSEALLGLRTGKITVEEASGSLKSIAKDAAPLLVEELKRSATDTKYANQIVAILSSLPPAAVRMPLTGALLEPGIVRTFAARIVGNVQDRETSTILEPHAGTDDEDFRLVIGESLVACRNAAGIPLLLQSLQSKEYSNRVIAIGVLRRLNGGEDFGYRATRPGESAEAIRKWDEWANAVGKTLFD